MVKESFPLFPLGVDEALVSFLVFKTMCGLRCKLGGFDSHALPPNLINQGFLPTFTMLRKVHTRTLFRLFSTKLLPFGLRNYLVQYPISCGNPLILMSNLWVIG